MLSSFAVISILLVASLYVPAYAAAWTTLIPADHISDVRYEGNIRSVTYDFGIEPIVYYSASGQQGNFYSSIDLQIDGQVGFPLSFGVYPLGIYSEANYPLSERGSGRIAIDASDFKSEAVLSLGSHFRVDLDLGYYSEYPVYDEESYTIGVSWSFLQYSDSGEYLGFLDGGSSSYYASLQDMEDYYVFEFELNHVSSIKLPSSDVGYLVPWANVNVNCSDDVDGIHVNSVQFAFDDFTISTRTDMLLKESLTMEAIEGELSDLNDKADTIINGTPEINDKIENMEDDVTNQKDDMHIVEDAEKEYLDQWEESNNKFKNIILTFLQGRGWVQLADLLSPFMNWSNWTSIMVMVVAFVNLSVILFGR